MLELDRSAQLKKGLEKRSLQQKKSPRKFPVKSLAEAFSDLNKLLTKFTTMVCNAERVSLIQKNIHTAASASKHTDDGKKEQSKQTSVDMPLQSDAPSRRALAWLSRGVSKGGSVVTGDDGSMGVTAQDLPVGRSGEGKAMTLTTLTL